MSKHLAIATAIATTCTDNDSRDECWEDYLQSLDGMCRPHNGSLDTSYEEARRMRLSYERWLIGKIETSGDRDTSFLESELDRLSSADDSGLSLWGTRPQGVGNIEYGIIEELPRWRDLGWTVDEDYADERSEDLPTDTAEDVDVISDAELKELAQMGPELTWVNEKAFVSKDEAQRFVDRVRHSFKKGDHSAEVVRCEVKKGAAEPFVAVILEADGNWEHRKALAAERDRQMANALNKVEKAETKGELDRLAAICRRYSRDMQVLNSGETFDGSFQNGRRCDIGFNYVRFAKVMNAIAARAAELGIKGYREYTITDFESTRKPADGDVLDVGCRQGEFLALEKADETCTEESMWSQIEGTWKPSSECLMRLVHAGPTGFVPRTWTQILADADAGVSLAVAV